MAWQLVAIVTTTVLAASVSATAIAALCAATWATALRTWTARCGTALAITTVVKTGIATLFLAASTVASAFAAAIALTFKARGALLALWSISA
jgi:hypothetical protein